MSRVVFQPTLEKLFFLDIKIDFSFNVDSPLTLQDLDGSASRIRTLRGVNFPRNLKTNNTLLNPIECIKSVWISKLAESLAKSTIASMTNIKFPANTKELNFAVIEIRAAGFEIAA